MAALAAGDKSGYEIYQQLKSDAQGGWSAGDWSVYRELPRLINRSLVEVVDYSNTPVRYRLTAVGRRQLKFESDRLGEVVRLVKERL